MKVEERSGLPEPARKRLVALLLVGAASTVAGLGLAVDTLIAVGLLLGLAGGLPSCRSGKRRAACELAGHGSVAQRQRLGQVLDKLALPPGASLRLLSR